MKTVAVFGAERTGKSSLIARFFGQPFTEEYKATIEECYCGKIYIGEKLYHMRIIDTSGSFAFPAMERLIMEKTDSFIFVYSIDDPKSFEAMKQCIGRLAEIKDLKSVSMVVVCNKTDLDDLHMLRAFQMKIDNVGALQERDFPDLARGWDSFPEVVAQRRQVRELGCKFLPTSAKLRWNVNRIFQELFAEGIAADYQQRRYSVLNTTLATVKSIMLKKMPVDG